MGKTLLDRKVDHRDHMGIPVVGPLFSSMAAATAALACFTVSLFFFRKSAPQPLGAACIPAAAHFRTD